MSQLVQRSPSPSTVLSAEAFVLIFCNKASFFAKTTAQIQCTRRANSGKGELSNQIGLVLTVTASFYCTCHLSSVGHSTPCIPPLIAFARSKTADTFEERLHTWPRISNERLKRYRSRTLFLPSTTPSTHWRMAMSSALKNEWSKMSVSTPLHVGTPLTVLFSLV